MILLKISVELFESRLVCAQSLCPCIIPPHPSSCDRGNKLMDTGLSEASQLSQTLNNTSHYLLFVKLIASCLIYLNSRCQLPSHPMWPSLCPQAHHQGQMLLNPMEVQQGMAHPSHYWRALNHITCTVLAENQRESIFAVQNQTRVLQPVPQSSLLCWLLLQKSRFFQSSPGSRRWLSVKQACQGRQRNDDILCHSHLLELGHHTTTS